MRARAIVIGAAAAAVATVSLGGLALARNPHCAGGIQYVVGGIRDKDKGNTEDYMRQMLKAVDQLQQCAAEDSLDYEALGYLGWAYAEIDSCGPAGDAFRKAIAGLTAKGDKKKAEWASNNLQSYWVGKFNDGIAKIGAAQAAYPDYTKQPADDAEKTLREEAGKKYEAALLSLTRASLLKPNDPQTMRSLGSIHAFMGDYAKAAEIFAAGLKAAPGDSTLQQSLKTVRTQHANQLSDQKKYDEAIQYYADLIQADPNNADLYLGRADAHFKQAQDIKRAQDSGQPADEKTKAAQDAKARAEFKAAGDDWAKASTIKTQDADLPFNAALAYNNANEPALAEPMWRAAQKLLPPDNVDVIAPLASTLADLKRYDDAVQVLHAALLKHPQEKALHRQLGSVYTKAGNNAKGTEELMVYLALQYGKAVDDPARTAGAASAPAQTNTLKAMGGPPDAVVPWQAQNESYETWFYWARHQAFHFKAGNLVQKSDWTAAAPAAGGAPAKK